MRKSMVRIEEDFVVSEEEEDVCKMDKEDSEGSDRICGRGVAGLGKIGGKDVEGERLVGFGNRGGRRRLGLGSSGGRRGILGRGSPYDMGGMEVGE